MTSQAMKLMHPDPPKKEEDISECLDNWVERVRRLEGHGTKHARPPLYKVTAMKLLMVGRAKENYEIWEADHKDDADGGFAKIQGTVKDYARKKKLDSAAKKAESKGGDPMDLDKLDQETRTAFETTLGDDWQEIMAVAKGKSKGKGKGGGFRGNCYQCGEYGHSISNCPQNPKGEGKQGRPNLYSKLRQPEQWQRQG